MIVHGKKEFEVRKIDRNERISDTVGLPVQSGQHASHSQEAFKMEQSHCAQHKHCLQEAHMVARGPALSVSPSPSPIPVPGPSNILVTKPEEFRSLHTAFFPIHYLGVEHLYIT